MASYEVNLSDRLLKEYFGPVCSEVGVFLLKNGISNLRTIFKNSSLTRNEIRKALCILIHHNICFSHTNSQKSFVYEIDVKSIFNILQYPRYVYSSKVIFGEIAELLTEELLKHGQLDTSELLKNVTSRLNDFYEGEKSFSLSQVRDNMVKLSKTYFIRHTVEDIEMRVNEKGEQERVSKPNFDVPKISEMKKRCAEESVNDNPRKRLKIESDDSQDEDVDITSDIKWTINHSRFFLNMRDQVLIKAVSRKMGFIVGEIVRALLNISEVRTDPNSECTVSVSKLELHQTLPKELDLTMASLEQYLTILEEDSMNILTKTDQSSGGMFSILIKKALKSILEAHLESIVQERFGSKALRVFKLLLLKKQMEQKQIEEIVMLSAKETKMILYKMFGENYISLTEVSRGESAGSRSYFLFSVNIDQLARLIMQSSYKAVYNLMNRREFEKNENKRVLEKQQRVEAILLQLDSAGANQEQKDEIGEMITPSEKKQLAAVKHRIMKLDQSEIQLSETIFIIQMYLNFSQIFSDAKTSKSAIT